jgi:outer membrane protein
VIVKPKYEGSDEHDVFGIPIIIPRFSDAPDDNSSMFKQFRQRVKFRGLDDIRLRLLSVGRFEAGAVTGYKTERDQGDGDLLRGLGDIDGGLVAGAYSGFRVGAFELDAAILEKVTGHDTGYEWRFGVETDRQLTPSARVVARVGTTLASNDYADLFRCHAGAVCALKGWFAGVLPRRRDQGRLFRARRHHRP